MRRRWLVVVVAAVALVASGCADDDEAAEETTTTEPEFAGTLITATEYEFDAPDTISASTVDVRFVNDGAVAHEAALVKIEDQAPDDFFTEFGPLLEAEEEAPPLPEAILNGTVGPGAGHLQPGDDPITAEITMTQGTWLLFCALTDADTEGVGDEEGGGGDADAQTLGRAQEEEEEGEEPRLPPHYELGMFQVIEVTGDTEPEFPEGPDGTVEVRDYEFVVPELAAGTHTLAATNTGPDQVHEGSLSDFGEGVTPEEAEAQFRAFIEQEVGGGGGDEEALGRAQEEEGGEPEDLPGFFVLAPGYGTTFDVTLEAGHTYLFACFVPDAEGGLPHAIGREMFTAFAVA